MCEMFQGSCQAEAPWIIQAPHPHPHPHPHPTMYLHTWHGLNHGNFPDERRVLRRNFHTKNWYQNCSMQHFICMNHLCSADPPTQSKVSAQSHKFTRKKKKRKRPKDKTCRCVLMLNGTAPAFAASQTSATPAPPRQMKCYY